MSHSTKPKTPTTKRTETIETRDNSGKLLNVCEVYNLLRWSEYLRGVDHSQTVQIRGAFWDSERRRAS